MNVLEELYQKLDSNEWDATNSDEINKAFQEVNVKFNASESNEILHSSEIERQAFAFHKSPKMKLSFKISGQQKTENGETIPFEWPDIKTFNGSDFDYLLTRFKNTKNLYAQTEYGLVLFYAGKLDINNIIALANQLLELARTYLGKTPTNKFYALYLRNTLEHLLFILSSRQGHKDINQLFKATQYFIFDIHQNWPVDTESSLRVTLDLTDFAIEYYKYFNESLPIGDFLKKNWLYGRKLAESDSWGAIYTADISIRLARKMKKDTSDWLIFKAEQYENLAKNAEAKGNMAAVSFIEKAMEIYRGIKSEDNLQRLQLKYQQIRGEFEIGGTSFEIDDEKQRIHKFIEETVQHSSEKDIILTLLTTPMIASVNSIRQNSDESFEQTTLVNLLPTIIKDNNGNTIANFETDEERKNLVFIRSYEFNLQVTIQTLVHIFIRALQEDKISRAGLIEFLKETWIGEEIILGSFGENQNISHLKLIEPGISVLFEEMIKWNKDKSYLPNFVAATDSLVLKTEFLLREIASKLNVPTFKVNPKNTKVIMEKLFDELLLDLTPHLSEDDLYFIKFIMVEKAGYNLRNQIAHGLMNNIQYSLESCLLALIAILKLSAYEFKPNTEGDENN